MAILRSLIASGYGGASGSLLRPGGLSVQRSKLRVEPGEVLAKVIRGNRAKYGYSRNGRKGVAAEAVGTEIATRVPVAP